MYQFMVKKMKKLTLAIASVTAIMAAGVHAETFTGEEGLDLNLTGTVDVLLGKSTVEEATADILFDDVKLGVNPVYTTDTGVKALANFEVSFAESQEANTAVNLENAYVGLGAMGAELTVGKQAYAADEFGIGKDIKLGAGDVLASTSGSDVVKASYEVEDMVKVVASLDVSEDEDEMDLDLFGQYTVMESITVAGTLQSHVATTDADAMMYFGVSGEYAMDGYSVAAEFTYDVDAEVMAYEVAGAYDVVEDITVAAGFGQYIDNDDSTDAVSTYYLNSEYKLHENASAYAELGGTSVENSELAYAVGMKVSF
jgi:uncharacterized protein YfcZ (UPF0381/DUF406 family)